MRAHSRRFSPLMITLLLTVSGCSAAAMVGKMTPPTNRQLVCECTQADAMNFALRAANDIGFRPMTFGSISGFEDVQGQGILQYDRISVQILETGKSASEVRVVLTKAMGGQEEAANTFVTRFTEYSGGRATLASAP